MKYAQKWQTSFTSHFLIDKFIMHLHVDRDAGLLRMSNCSTSVPQLCRDSIIDQESTKIHGSMSYM